MGMRKTGAVGARQKERPDAEPLKTPFEGHRRIPGVGCHEVEVTCCDLNFSLDETELGLRSACLVNYAIYCDMGCRSIFRSPLFIGARWRWDPCGVRVSAEMRRVGSVENRNRLGLY